MKNWEKEFDEKFKPDKIWVVPSSDNIETIKEIKQFISSKLKEERERVVLKGERNRIIAQLKPYSVSEWEKIGRKRGYWDYFRKKK